MNTEAKKSIVNNGINQKFLWENERKSFHVIL
jgi:hypothetical protein